MVPPDGDSHLLAALVLSGSLIVGCKQPASPQAAPVQVAAASDLTLAFEELGTLFETRTGQ